MRPFRRRGANLDAVTLASVRRAMGQVVTTCRAVADGDLEARLEPMNLVGVDPADEAELRSAFNSMLDVMDAYMRESSAAITAASEKRFYRRLLEGGLRGAFLDGARIIESGRVAMEAANDAARSAAESRSALAARLEASLVGLADEVTDAAGSMGDTASGWPTTHAGRGSRPRPPAARWSRCGRAPRASAGRSR